MILFLRTSRQRENKRYSLYLEVQVLSRVLSRAGVISPVYPKDGHCNTGQVCLKNLGLNIEVRFTLIKGRKQKYFCHELYKFTQNTLVACKAKNGFFP